MDIQADFFGSNSIGVRYRRTFKSRYHTDFIGIDVHPFYWTRHLKHVCVDVVGTRHQNFLLTATFSAISQECTTILEALVTFNSRCEYSAFRYFLTIHGSHFAVETVLDHNGIDHGHSEKSRVNSVDTGCQDVDLRSFLSTILEKCLAILIHVAFRTCRSHDVSIPKGFSIFSLHEADLVLMDHSHFFWGCFEKVRIEAVHTRCKHRHLRTFLTAIGDKCLSVFKHITFHITSDDLPFIERFSINRCDNPDLIIFDVNTTFDLNIKYEGIDTIDTGLEDFQLRSLFSTIGEESLYILESITFHRISHNATTCNRFTIQCFHLSISVCRNFFNGFRMHLEEKRIDSVFTGRDNLLLRTFLSIVFEKGFTILEAIAFHKISYITFFWHGTTSDSLNHTKLVDTDYGDVRFPCLLDEGDNEMETRTKHTCLDTDLATESDRTSICHLFANVLLFDSCQLFGADVHERFEDKDDEKHCCRHHPNQVQ